MKARWLTLAVLGVFALSVMPTVDAHTTDEAYLFGLINQQRSTSLAKASEASSEQAGDVQRRRRRRGRRRQPDPAPNPNPNPDPIPPAPGGSKTLKEHAFILGLTRTHTQDMIRRDSLDHNGFEQRSSSLRANDSGVGYVCENVAYAGRTTAKEALDTIFQGWMNSPGHRRCMLDQNGYTTSSAAVGVFKSGDTWWATFIAAEDRTP